MAYNLENALTFVFPLMMKVMTTFYTPGNEAVELKFQEKNLVVTITRLVWSNRKNRGIGKRKQDTGSSSHSTF